MSGNVAVVGVFPQNRTITYRRRGNNWEESIRMNLPDMTSFSFRDGLLVVTAGVCNFLSCMSSASFFEQSDDDWLKIDEMAIDDGDYFDALIDGELVVLRYRTGVREDDCSSSFYKLIEEEIVMQDQRPIEGCGQMVVGEGLLAHAVDGGVAMHQEHGSVFVVNHSGEATDSELELSLHKNVLAVGGLRGDKIKVFSNGTGDNAMNWTEVLELDLFNAGLLHDSFDVFGGFLSVIEGHDLFTFDLSRCTPARTVVPAEEEIAEGSTECYPVNIWCVGEDWTASVKSADGESVGKTLRPDVPSYNKHLEQLCLFEGQYKFQLQMKLTTREYKVRLNVPKRDSSLGRVLLRSGLTGDEILESTLWVPFDLDSPENRLPTNFPSSGSTPTVGTGGTLSPTANVIRPDPPTTFSPTVSDRPSLSNEPTLAPSASTRPSDSKKPSTPPSMSLTPTATPSDLPSRSPSDMPTSRPSEEPRYCIIISIVYDYFPAETSWELISDEDGAIVHEYQETDDTETSHSDWFCLTEGRYTFKIFDELGDGIRSEDNGQGSYAIASDDYGWSDGIILAQGGEFADVDIANFVLPYVMPSIAPSSSKIPTAFPTFIPSLSPSSSKTPTASPTFGPSLSPSSSQPPSSSVSPSCGGSLIMIQIQYDSFPGETSFDLKKIVSEEGQETELASYHSGSAGDKNYDESICLGDGLYHFSLYDSYGDGFNGEYSLKLMPGETIIMRDNRVSLYGEQVLFRLPFDRETLDVRTIGSNGRLFTPPTPSPTVGSPVPNTPFPTEGTPVPNTPFPTEGTPSPTVSHRPSVSHSPSMVPSSTSGPSVSISPSCGGSLMMIKIQYDRYPDETSYELEKIASEDGQETEVASHSEYSLTLVTGEIIIMRDDGVSKCREQVKFRLPFDGDTLDVVPIGSDAYVPPTANPDSASVSSGGYVFIAVLGNDVPAGQLYVSSITRQATNGYCSVSLDLVDVVYSPYSGFIGTDTCVYEACDTQGLCDDATVTVTTRFLTR
ncbi:hypothetical protein THAOC_30892 [Thalassiosira oceanica]|uniref:Uncharacterized protein n=1 Tax=Thalassiosira oceanica TaxID=159749 RepID=K0RMR6_THAOC|nr:hypothetical protein THAOC_30892 [Thalassiosira oceanica]|eukprot:EJK50166.1 hypothetical protein THAOC_30892 [Thalassiosira oceanica]